MQMDWQNQRANRAFANFFPVQLIFFNRINYVTVPEKESHTAKKKKKGGGVIKSPLFIFTMVYFLIQGKDSVPLLVLKMTVSDVVKITGVPAKHLSKGLMKQPFLTQRTITVNKGNRVSDHSWEEDCKVEC